MNIAINGLCVVGVARQAGLRSHATSITPRVKTLRVVESKSGIQDVVLVTHKRTAKKQAHADSVLRSHNFVTYDGRFYDYR